MDSMTNPNKSPEAVPMTDSPRQRGPLATIAVWMARIICGLAALAILLFVIPNFPSFCRQMEGTLVANRRLRECRAAVESQHQQTGELPDAAQLGKLISTNWPGWTCSIYPGTSIPESVHYYVPTNLVGTNFVVELKRGHDSRNYCSWVGTPSETLTTTLLELLMFVFLPLVAAASLVHTTFRLGRSHCGETAVTPASGTDSYPTADARPSRIMVFALMAAIASVWLSSGVLIWQLRRMPPEEIIGHFEDFSAALPYGSGMLVDALSVTLVVVLSVLFSSCLAVLARRWRCRRNGPVCLLCVAVAWQALVLACFVLYSRCMFTLPSVIQFSDRNLPEIQAIRRIVPADRRAAATEAIRDYMADVDTGHRRLMDRLRHELGDQQMDAATNLLTAPYFHSHEMFAHGIVWSCSVETNETGLISLEAKEAPLQEVINSLNDGLDESMRCGWKNGRRRVTTAMGDVTHEQALKQVLLDLGLQFGGSTQLSEPGGKAIRSIIDSPTTPESTP